MKGYDYYLTEWPRIVADAFEHGAAIYEAVLVRDDTGKPIRYERGRRLNRRQALRFRGATWAVYEPTTQAVMER